MRTTTDIFNPRDNSLIIPSTTYLYYKDTNVFNKEEGAIKAYYRPFSIRDGERLQIISDALLGDKTAQQSAVFKSTVVRYGWLDHTLSSLAWMPLSELLEQYQARTIAASDKRKLDAVTRLLFLSLRDIVVPGVAEEKAAKKAAKEKARLEAKAAKKAEKVAAAILKL